MNNVEELGSSYPVDSGPLLGAHRAMPAPHVMDYFVDYRAPFVRPIYKELVVRQVDIRECNLLVLVLYYH